MAKVVKCHGGGYMMVGRYTKAQEAEIYKMLGDGPRAWFRRDPRDRTAAPAAPTQDQDLASDVRSPEASDGH
jgi:hypothetical protein